MSDISYYAMEILRLQIPVEGISIPLFGLVAGMLIVYLVIKIIFQKKE